MQNAMADGGVKPEEITYINAHGTSTHHNDLFETRAIKLAFGEHAYKLRINSTKSMVGHLLGAAGAVAAWSCGVPALCLGADPRAVGLAQELFGSWQELVLPVGLVRREEELAQRFRILLSREDRIRRRLRAAVPERRAYAAQWNGRMMRRA